MRTALVRVQAHLRLVEVLRRKHEQRWLATTPLCQHSARNLNLRTGGTRLAPYGKALARGLRGEFHVPRGLRAWTHTQEIL